MDVFRDFRARVEAKEARLEAEEREYRRFKSILPAELARLEQVILYLTLEGVAALARELGPNHSLMGLCIHSPPIGCEGAHLFVEALRINRCLKELELNMGDEGLVIFAEALKVNATLTSLTLSFACDCARKGYGWRGLGKGAKIERVYHTTEFQWV